MRELRGTKAAAAQPAPAPIISPAVGDFASVEDLAALEKRVFGNEENIGRVNGDMQRGFASVQEILNTKATYDDLDALEKKIMDKIAALLQAMSNKFADKAEVKKALKALEKQLKNLYDLIMNAKPSNPTEQDAMFSKKPLGGFSCASCAKGLTNLQGQIAEFYPWGKLPFRDPNERIARYGAGFSKMLSMLKPEHSMQTSWSPDGHQQSKMSAGANANELQPHTSYQPARGSSKKFGHQPAHSQFSSTTHQGFLKRGSGAARNKGVPGQAAGTQQQ